MIRLVEVGRIVLITYGPDTGKIAVITDILDHSRVVVDGPTTDVTRQAVSFRRLALTKFVIHIPRGAGATAVAKALAKHDTVAKWSETTWAKKLQTKKTRAELTDFERFKVMVAKKEVLCAHRRRLDELTPVFP